MNLNEIINYLNDESIPQLEARMELDYEIVAKLVDGDEIEFDVFRADTQIELNDVPEKVISIIDEIVDLFEEIKRENLV